MTTELIYPFLEYQSNEGLLDNHIAEQIKSIYVLHDLMMVNPEVISRLLPRAERSITPPLHWNLKYRYKLTGNLLGVDKVLLDDGQNNRMAAVFDLDVWSTQPESSAKWIYGIEYDITERFVVSELMLRHPETGNYETSLGGRQEFALLELGKDKHAVFDEYERIISQI